MGNKRVGVIGYGYIGRDVVRRIEAATGVEVAFVHNRSAAAVADLDPSLVLRDVADAGEWSVDLVVETAHRSITRDHGVSLIGLADYMPLSTTALVDDDLRAALMSAGEAAGHRLFLAAGALIGGSVLAMRPQAWERVKITFRKHPQNLDLSESGLDIADIAGPTTIFLGSAREIAGLFPRNVNTMVTCALLSVGLDACECELVADPGLDRAVAEVEAWGHDGGYVRTDIRQPAVGVSGTEMLDSVWFSVTRALGLRSGGLDLV